MMKNFKRIVICFGLLAGIVTFGANSASADTKERTSKPKCTGGSLIYSC
ncbi:hypothetical protein [Bacillus cereus]|nr:hypothetical protein [Bacillus cereus]